MPPFESVPTTATTARCAPSRTACSGWAIELRHPFHPRHRRASPTGPSFQTRISRTAMDSGYRALDRLRSEGVVKAIGVGVNEWQVCQAALPRARLRLLPARRTLHAPGAGGAGHFPAALRGAGRRRGARRRLQFRASLRPVPCRGRSTTTRRRRTTSWSASGGSRRSARRTACR